MVGFFESIAGAKKGGELLAAWVTEGKGAGSKALFERGKPVFLEEGFPEDAAGAIRTAGSGRTEILEIGESRIFLDRISQGKRLVVCGAGHVALCVIRLGVMLGYGVTVIEDREEFAAKAREAGAGQVLCMPFGEALDKLGEDPGAAYVVMTREHSHDVDCLRKILRGDYIYAGMMGSRSRAEQIRRQLAEEGYDAGKVGRLHMPIGLEIESRTPEEIAVSVAAELIRELNAADPGEGFPPGMIQELAAAERAGKPAGVLALITEKNGEAPRRPGTGMLVRNDGSFLGTVGGGYAEAEILRTARKMIREENRKGRLVRITMKKGTMHCGGDIAVLLSGV